MFKTFTINGETIKLRYDCFGSDGEKFNLLDDIYYMVKKGFAIKCGTEWVFDDKGYLHLRNGIAIIIGDHLKACAENGNTVIHVVGDYSIGYAIGVDTTVHVHSRYSNGMIHGAGSKVFSHVWGDERLIGEAPKKRYNFGDFHGIIPVVIPDTLEKMASELEKSVDNLGLNGRVIKEIKYIPQKNPKTEEELYENAFDKQDKQVNEKHQASKVRKDGNVIYVKSFKNKGR